MSPGYLQGLRSRCASARMTAPPARILARGERTELSPALYLPHGYETAHPRPEVDEFVLHTDGLEARPTWRGLKGEVAGF